MMSGWAALAAQVGPFGAGRPAASRPWGAAVTARTHRSRHPLGASPYGWCQNKEG